MLSVTVLNLYVFFIILFKDFDPAQIQIQIRTNTKTMVDCVNEGRTSGLKQFGEAKSPQNFQTEILKNNMCMRTIIRKSDIKGILLWNCYLETTLGL